MTNYEELIARLESRTELGLTLNKEAATAIQQLVAERDAALNEARNFEHLPAHSPC